MAEMKMPRFMISATGSGCGKTTITCGILKALMNKGLKVAAFKSGPDYIDPMFHSKVIGAKSRNLDVFMLGKETVKFLAAKNACDVNVSVFEGAMGFYDGMGKTAEASAYDLARTCDVPVILIVNGKGAALSVAAQIKGFKEFRQDSHIVGAILNNVNPMSYAYYKDVIEAESGVKLLGYFPVLEGCNFESRHLGLVTAEEIGDLQAIVERLALQAEKSLDLEGLLELANSAPALEYTPQNMEALGKVKLAIAQDKAFCFYYQDALDLLGEWGAELVPCSPITDKHLPECDGLILGGGYPELYKEKLSQNKTMLDSVKNALQNNMPCIAECGGFMYLTEYIEDLPMVGYLKGKCFDNKKLTRFGYITLKAKKDNMLCKRGDEIPAHEFHYWDSENTGEDFKAEKISGKSWDCVFATETLYAGYPHFHFCANKDFAKNFYKACLKEKKRYD